MKKLFLFSMLWLLAAATQAQNDSIKSETLPEIVVNADGQIETADKVVLLPTTIEKKHSANGFDLLNVMQMTELEVSPRTRNITTHGGGEVVLCINGMEALPEDVASLRAKNIRSIEYIRTPSGKYAGKAGLLNFITVKLEYGGNVFLSATEGLTFKTGDYLAFTDFTQKGLTLSLTASGDWTHDHSYSEGHEDFTFADHTTLARDFTHDSSLRKSNNQAARLKLTSKGNSHRLSSYVSLTRQAVPTAKSAMKALYCGHYDGTTQRLVLSDSRGLAPSAYVNYTLWLPEDQTIDFTAQASFGHNIYYSLYNETSHDAISSAVTEDNNTIRSNARYYKSWKNGLTLSGSLTHDHNQYRDIYMGTSASDQRLTTDVTMAVVQLNGSSQKYYYYVSAGMSNSAVKLNDNHFTYCSPVAFYGSNCALSQDHSFSINGLFTHTLFDPSNKNDITIPTSFFEALKGNPDLTPMKVMGNTLSYNGQMGKSKLSVSYDNNIFFANILHRYDANNQTIYDSHTNDGTFYGNMLAATYAYSAFTNKLRLSITGIEEYNLLRGDTYNLSCNIIRAKASVTYLINEWIMQFIYCTPYTTLNIREPYFISRRPVYEWLVSWNHNNWAAKALVRNPLSRYAKQHITMDYGCYHRDVWNYNESDGCNINLTLTYSLGYGKKSELGNTDIEKKINSAILRAH